MNNKYFRALTIAFSFLMTAVIFSGDALGQGRYVERYQRGDVSSIIQRLETSSNRFREAFENQVNRASLSNSEKNRLKRIVRDYENSLDELRDDFDRRETWWESRQRVQKVISDAQDVNVMINTLTFRRNIENQWNRMREDLNTLADTYDLPGLDGGGWTGGPWNPGFPGGGIPNWSVGTWDYNNGVRRLMITESGNVRLYTRNGTWDGTIRGSNVVLNRQNYTITPLGGRLRMRNLTNGETFDYTRFAGEPGGGVTNPPSWAVGTWQSTRNRRERLTIFSNGTVMFVVNGAVNNGVFTNNNAIQVMGRSLMISRNGARLRTYDQMNGQTLQFNRVSGTPGGGGGVPIGTPPQWAVGNWQWLQGTQRRLVITADGRVTAYDGAMSYPGYFASGTYFINNQPHTLTRVGQRVRLYNQFTGDTYVYRRR